MKKLNPNYFNSINYLKKLLAFLSMTYLLACSSEGLPPGERGGGFKLADDDKHSAVVETLDQRDIPYEKNDRGLTVYMLKNQAEVLGIIRTVQYGNELSENIIESAILQNESIKEKYISEFNANGIPYRIEKNGEITDISWLQVYGPKVDQIRQKIEIELRRELRNLMIQEGKIPANLIDNND